MIFRFLKVRRIVPESKLWKPHEPDELKSPVAMKFVEILHEEQLYLLLKTENRVPLPNRLRSVLAFREVVPVVFVNKFAPKWFA